MNGGEIVDAYTEVRDMMRVLCYILGFGAFLSLIMVIVVSVVLYNKHKVT